MSHVLSDPKRTCRTVQYSTGDHCMELDMPKSPAVYQKTGATFENAELPTCR